jgi:hypothetical protein
MITRGIREFVSRDWDLARRNKEAHWLDRIARFGPVEALRIADELRRQARLLDPDWPSAALREDDFQSHVALTERLRRAGPTRRG